MVWNRIKRPHPKPLVIWEHLEPHQRYWLQIKMSRKSPASTGTLRKLQRLMKKAAKIEKPA